MRNVQEGIGTAHYKAELRRSLSTWDLVVYGMVFMVPIAPWGVFGFVWHDSKGMVPLAYLIGLFGMFFTALSYAAMSRAFPVAGSVYAYAQHGIHEVAGFFAGWLILLDYILIPALVYLFAAVPLKPIFPNVPAIVWITGFVLFNAVVNLLGVRLTVRVNLYMLTIELATLALFIVAGLVALHAGIGAGGLTLRPIYDPRVFSLATVAGATSIAVLSFLGFDGISTLSEETSGGRGSVGRATIVALLVVGALFMVQSWIASDLARGMRFASLATAFYEIAGRIGGVWLRDATILVSSVAAGIATAMAAQAAVSRVLFAMARDGKLPSPLAKIHPRFQTPYISTLVVACISLVVGAIFSQRIDDLSRIVNFGALTGFILLHLSVINHYFIRGRSGRWVRHLVFPLVGLSVITYVLYEMDNSAKIMGATWIGIGVIYYLVLTRILNKPVTLEV